MLLAPGSASPLRPLSAERLPTRLLPLAFPLEAGHAARSPRRRSDVASMHSNSNGSSSSSSSSSSGTIISYQRCADDGGGSSSEGGFEGCLGGLGDGEAAGWPEWNDGVLYHDRISAKSFPNQTLIDFYTSRYKQSASQKGWLQRIRNGQITLDGIVVTSPNTILKTGSNLCYHRKPWKEDHAPSHVVLIYEDDHIMVVSKPSGLQVMRGGYFHQRTLVSLLENYHVRNSNPSSSSDKWIPAPVHRLGRGTSGLVLCAKSPFAKSYFSMLFAFKTDIEMKKVSNICRPGEVRKKERIKNKLKLDETTPVLSKIYRALLSGIVMEDKFVVDKPIGKTFYDGLFSEGLYMALETGKPSYSEFHVIWRDYLNDTTLVEVNLGTGRAHQIRIHSAVYGFPLVGDPLYGKGGIPHLFLSGKQEDMINENQDPPEDKIIETQQEFNTNIEIDNIKNGYKNKNIDQFSDNNPVENHIESNSSAEQDDDIEEDGGHSRSTHAMPGDCGYFLHSFKLTMFHPIKNKIFEATYFPPPKLRLPHETNEHFLPLWKEL